MILIFYAKNKEVYAKSLDLTKTTSILLYMNIV